MSDELVEAGGEHSLEELSAEINAAHEACQAALTQGLGHALTAGRLLIEAKSRLPHGNWGQWLHDHCTVSERTAQAYMRVAREIPPEEAQRVADLSFRQTMKMLSEPNHQDPDRMEFVRQAIVHRQTAEEGEAKASPYLWGVADCYAELGRRGWGTRRIATRCTVLEREVFVLIQMVAMYPDRANRPPFRKAFEEMANHYRL